MSRAHTVWPITLTLPLPPSVNHAYRDATIHGRRRRVQTGTVRAYKEVVATLARGARVQRLEGDLELVAVAYFKDRRRDVSNILKVLEDSLKGIAFADDRQVHRIVLEKRYDKGNPRVELRIAPWTDTPRKAHFTDRAA